ncbi:hypothetical protein GA830_18650 (plasmid) [Mesorhizobium sp. NBSH29]|nr:hypothetical protein GA830_18650 [Mesorhizobium sp. NBSH29]
MIFLERGAGGSRRKRGDDETVHGLKSPYRFCLTGTPLENHLGEVWSLFHFIAPGFLGDLKSFTRQWRTPIEKKGDNVALAAAGGAHQAIPAASHQGRGGQRSATQNRNHEKVEFSAGQRTIYESIRLAMHEKVQSRYCRKRTCPQPYRHSGCSAEVAPDLLRPTPAETCLNGKTGAAAKTGSAKLEPADGTGRRARR